MSTKESGAPAPDLSPLGAELCNGRDDDGDFEVDEGCSCATDKSQACYPFAPWSAQGACKAGIKLCQPNGQWGPCIGSKLPIKEICGNNIDEDCDGKDKPCPGQVIPVPVLIYGDCVTASCPPSNPYPVGCNIILDGGDNRGCVASSPTNPVVYFQEGDKCKKGKVKGVLYCSTKPGAPLNAWTCFINKFWKYYPSNKYGCPKTSG